MALEAEQFVLYKDAANEWRWTLYGKNSKTIADSAEGYKNKADCLHGARLVASISPSTAIWNGTDKVWE
jgi:uncharacterized protein YegP (UPF0339 family)